MKEKVKQHKYSVDSKKHFDEKQFEKFLNSSIKLSRYVIDFKHYVSYFNTFDVLNGNISPVDAFAAAPYSNNKNKITMSHAFIDFVGGDKIYENAVYQLQSNITIQNTILSDVIALTESSSQKDQKNKIVDTVQAVEGCPYHRNRKAMLAFNIMDLNVVPINLHALMREIPLINLINYSYTFDHLMSELLNFKIDKTLQPLTLDDKIIAEREPAKKILSLMLVNPYIQMDYNIYANYISIIMQGGTDISGFGRPKYLGDEVYNKALFGEIYSSKKYMDEGGPKVAIGKLKTKQDILTQITRDMYGSEYRLF